MIASAEEFAVLRAEDDPRATHDPAPEEVWRAVIRQFPQLRGWVAHNKTVPVAILRVLAEDPDPRVRHAVAMKRKNSPEIFERLARDPDEKVRVQVARNAKAPPHVLQMLRADTSRLVADAVAARS